MIYFDEGSVTDFIQIIEGGQLTRTMELLSGNETKGKVDGEAEVSIGINSLFRKMIGIGANGKIDASIEDSYRDDSLVKTILQNTILTDFIESAEEEGSDIKVFENIRIKVIKDSLSYIIMVSPYLKMLKGEGLSVNADIDMSIDMVKLDDSIRLAKGYFEFEGVVKDKSVILRFNIDSFKNNYKIADLQKMRLMVYAVFVGKARKENFSIVSEIGATPDGNDSCSNPKYGEEEEEDKLELEVYDVLLAGVAGHE